MSNSLYKSLKQFSHHDKTSFHMPGHKNGAGFSSRFKNNAFELDVTEFAETDDLQNPTSILLDAQARAATAFGAEKSFYITSGSTTGLLAAILGTVKRGEKLIVDRTCHKAVISAIIMGGIDPVFIDADFDEVHGIYCGINNNSLLNILSENEDVVGAIITSPTYYGICSDIKAIADSLHKAGKFLIVDEAHGSHFVFNEKLPNTALELGADVCIQSLHKTLPALGQSSLLHIGKTDLVDINSIENHLRLLHTTSPSYMIMASMDEAILKMQQDTKNFEKLIDLVINLKTKIDVVGKLKCLKSNDFQNQYDILRLVVNFENIGISGYDACEVLNRVYGIYPELADNKNVVFIITIGNTKKDIDSLETALEEMTITDFEPKTIKPQMKLPSINLCFSPHRAWNSESETVRIQDANDKICAEIVASCPPGCAILVPGQMIDADTIAYITEQTAIKYVKTII